MPDKKPSVIVTGSNGFIGHAVCEAFVKDGYAVIGFDRPDSGKLPANITDIACDVTSEQSVTDAVNRVLREFGAPLASVIHLGVSWRHLHRAVVRPP